MKGKYLITTDGWFMAPDGLSYRAVWGEVKIVGDEVLGIKTNRNSSNWFAQVGTEDKHIIIAGCQIHYAVRTEKQPHAGYVNDYHADAANGLKTFDRPSQIWIAG